MTIHDHPPGSALSHGDEHARTRVAREPFKIHTRRRVTTDAITRRGHEPLITGATNGERSIHGSGELTDTSAGDLGGTIFEQGCMRVRRHVEVARDDGVKCTHGLQTACRMLGKTHGIVRPVSLQARHGRVERGGGSEGIEVNGRAKGGVHEACGEAGRRDEESAFEWRTHIGMNVHARVTRKEQEECGEQSDECGECEHAADARRRHGRAGLLADGLVGRVHG